MTNNPCKNFHRIYIYDNDASCARFGMNTRNMIEGFDEDRGIWWIGGMEGHPRESMEMVASSVFANLPIPARHKYKLLQPLPRPGMSEPGLVSFYQTDEKRKRQILTVMKPGRYLRKTLVDDNGEALYSDTKIEEWANLWITEYSNIRMHLLSTSEDIAKAYMNGPNSCMSHHPHQFDCAPHHPCEVYGEGENDKGKWIETDTRLAVICADDNGEDDYVPNPEAVIARCVVVPEKKIRGPVYGDRYKLEMLLENLNYEKNSDEFQGVKMRHIESDRGTVCPYFDFGAGAYVSGDHLIACFNCDGGENQNGLLGFTSMCVACEDSIHPDDEVVDRYGDTFCENCFHEVYQYCHVAEDFMDRDEMIPINGVASYQGLRISEVYEGCRDELISYGAVFECEYDNELYATDSYDQVEDNEGQIFEADNFFRFMEGFRCEYTEEYFSAKDFRKVEVSDGVFVAHHEDAGYGVEAYKDWLVKHGYRDEEFEDELEDELEEA